VLSKDTVQQSRRSERDLLCYAMYQFLQTLFHSLNFNSIFVLFWQTKKPNVILSMKILF